MCLIIQRQPGIILPFDKFKTAVENNPDGFGLSYPDNGKLVTMRSHEKNDADELYRFINEELIDKVLMVHLRYRTAGDVNLRNAHPFPVLEKREDGIDLRMAHNGTIHKYKDKGQKWESDTRAFVRQFVRPLFKRLARGYEPEEFLTDPFIQQLLEDQIPQSSVLSFIDGQGNSMVANPTGNGGYYEEGVYFSNKYSFNEKHRTPPTRSVTYLPPSGGTMSNQTIGTKTTGGDIPPFAADCKTERFSSRHNIKVNELFLLSDDTIDRISKIPMEASALIKELLYEWQTSDSLAEQCWAKLTKGKADE